MKAADLTPGTVVRVPDMSGGRWDDTIPTPTKERTVVKVEHGGWDAWGKERAAVTFADADGPSLVPVAAEYDVVGVALVAPGTTVGWQAVPVIDGVPRPNDADMVWADRADAEDEMHPGVHVLVELVVRGQ